MIKTRVHYKKTSSKPVGNSRTIQQTGLATAINMNDLQAKICTCEGDCPRCLPVQAKLKNENPENVATTTADLNVLKQGGHSLPKSQQQFFESRFGHDFSGVRIHTGEQAGDLAQALGARAFTFGNNIVFDADQYQPKTTAGKKLLAHELTHVMQQQAMSKSSPLGMVQRATPLTIKLPPDTIEELLDEFEALVQADKIEEARALIPEVKRSVEGPWAMDYGARAAEAFFSVGATQDALAMLEETRGRMFGGKLREDFSRETAKKMLEKGRQALQSDDPDTAYTILKYLFKWLQNVELVPSVTGDEWLEKWTETMYPRVIEALMAVPQYHQTQNNEAKAKTQRAEIKTMVIQSPLTAGMGMSLAKVLMDVNAPQDAFEVLEATHKAWDSPGKEPYRFSMKAINLLLEKAQAALAKPDTEQAYTYYLKAYQWLAKPELNFTLWDLGAKRTFQDEKRYEAVLGMLSLVDIHVKHAESDYQANKQPEAQAHMEKAEKMLEQIAADLLTSDIPNVIIAKVEQPKMHENKAYYQGAMDPGKKLPVSYYEEDVTQFDLLMGHAKFEDRIASIGMILANKAEQIQTVKTMYEGDRAVMDKYAVQQGNRPDIHKLSDRRKFWPLKYDALIAEGKTRPEALKALFMEIENYLQTFTIHTHYDIPDALPEILTDDMPQAGTRQLLLDCGAYALRTAYEMSLIRSKANLDFYYVFLPNHAIVGMIDQARKFGWYASNDRFCKIKEDIAGLGVGRAIATAYSKVVPVPFQEQAIPGAGKQSVLSAYKTPRQQLFYPVDDTSLSAYDKQQAKAKARELKAKYYKLRKDVSSGIMQVLDAMVDLEAKYIAQGGITDKFKKEAIPKIESLLPEYKRLSEELLEEYYNELKEIYGVDGPYTHQIRYYFEAAYYLMRFLVYPLGMTKYQGDDYIVDPIFKNPKLEYKGDPLPWEEIKK